MSEFMEILELVDDHGDSLLLTDYGKKAQVEFVGSHWQGSLFFGAEDVDKLIAWLATWKEKADG